MKKTDGHVVVSEAATKRDLKTFASWPCRLYRGHPAWVPPLAGEERRSFLPAHNALLAGSDYTLLLARRGRTVVGRMLVFIEHKFNVQGKSRIGFFGCFECREDLEAARALFQTAEAWLSERGMTAVRGPIHQYKEMWGFLLEGYDNPPVFMSPYNPPYYHSFMDELGFHKAKDLLAYEADAAKGYRIPARFRRFCDMFVMRHPGFSVRRLDPRHLMRDATHIWRITDAAVADNWGYVTYDEHEFHDMVRAFRVLIDPDAIWFVEHKGEVVGYCLGFPDVNVVLKKIRGRLFPFGILTLLALRKRIKRYRLFGLAVLPEYHGKGLDVLLYIRLAEALTPKGIRLEANYILEDNFKIRNPIEKLALRLVRTYRVYEKALAEEKHET